MHLLQYRRLTLLALALATSACARAEGAAFSLRAFHDRLLEFGAIPVPMIASLMNAGAT